LFITHLLDCANFIPSSKKKERGREGGKEEGDIPGFLLSEK
jgi:hypothetical protein